MKGFKMIYQFESARAFLQHQFDERTRNNPRYSLRSYARFLRVNPAEISQVFKQQRNLSFSSARKIIQAQGFNPDEAKHFLWALQVDKGKADLAPSSSSSASQARSNLSLQKFSQICDWHHFAILNLVDTKNFRWDSAFVAKKLGLSLSEAGLAMRDLQQADLVKVEKKSPRSTKTRVSVASAIPAEAIRRYHRQMLQKALNALETVPHDLREYQSVGLVLNQTDLEKLKIEIDEFTERLMGKYHRHAGQLVYQIQVCAFPLTKDS